MFVQWQLAPLGSTSTRFRIQPSEAAAPAAPLGSVVRNYVRLLMGGEEPPAPHIPAQLVNVDARAPAPIFSRVALEPGESGVTVRVTRADPRGAPHQAAFLLNGRPIVSGSVLAAEGEILTIEGHEYRLHKLQ